MGWFKKGDVCHTNLQDDDPKMLKGVHPVVIVESNEDTSKVIGCTSKSRPDDIKIETTPKMSLDTYARTSQGERTIDNNKLMKDRENRICDNVNELKGKKK